MGKYYWFLKEKMIHCYASYFAGTIQTTYFHVVTGMSINKQASRKCSRVRELVSKS
jgi:hypothetical protein